MQHSLHILDFFKYQKGRQKTLTHKMLHVSLTAVGMIVVPSHYNIMLFDLRVSYVAAKLGA